VGAKIIRDGNFSPLTLDLMVIIGAFFMIIAFKYFLPSLFGGFLFFLGFGIGTLGGLASTVHMLDIKPFDNEYKKARKTYISSDKNEDS